jgi:predicted metal-dependent HD superfamily phosphohydrolase
MEAPMPTDRTHLTTEATSGTAAGPTAESDPAADPTEATSGVVDGPTVETAPAENPAGDLTAELMARWNATLPNQEQMGAALLKRYAEPHRRYHTAQHLAQVLRTIDELAGTEDLFLVRLAAWFHDAVYAIPPGQLPNEEASARLAIRELGRAGLEQEDLTQVARLVRLTATHVPGSRDSEGELLCDADLSILAALPETYAAYAAAIRDEYARVPETEFVAGRLDILTRLAEGEIFRTTKGRALTTAARANLAGECAALETRLAAVGVERTGSPGESSTGGPAGRSSGESSAGGSAGRSPGESPAGGPAGPRSEESAEPVRGSQA